MLGGRPAAVAVEWAAAKPNTAALPKSRRVQCMDSRELTLHSETVQRIVRAQINAPAGQCGCRIARFVQIVYLHHVPLGPGLQYGDLAFFAREVDLSFRRHGGGGVAPGSLVHPAGLQN